MDSTERLKQVSEQVRTCNKCKLHLSRRLAVPGEGPANCKIMLIGEGPGFHENEQGRPFVGASGKFLDELLKMAGLERSEVFITNVVKCRPPQNREPSEEELLTCRPFLEEQIEIINPEVIVTLGRYSMAHFIENGKISYIHGHPQNVNNRLIIPMYHPAAALHQPSLKEVLLSDFSKIPGFLSKKTSSLNEIEIQDESHLKDEIEQDEKKDNENRQLSLFG